MSETIPTQTPVSVPTNAPRAGAPLLPPGSVGLEQLTPEVQAALLPGAWLELEALNKIEDGVIGQSLRVRTEDGNNARFRGGFKTTAAIPNGTRIATVPAACRPPAGYVELGALTTLVEAPVVVRLELLHNGELLNKGPELALGKNVTLDDLTWNIT